MKLGQMPYRPVNKLLRLSFTLVGGATIAITMYPEDLGVECCAKRVNDNLYMDSVYAGCMKVIDATMRSALRRGNFVTFETSCVDEIVDPRINPEQVAYYYAVLIDDTKQ